MFLTSIVIAASIDILIGWPNWLYLKIGHPVTWIAILINFFDTSLNKPKNDSFSRKLGGLASVVVIVGSLTILTHFIQDYLDHGLFKTIFIAILCWPFLAIKSMYEHVKRVYDELNNNNIKKARQEVSMIVGRDTSQMMEEGIVSSCIESLAENTSDGIIAPLFWGAIFGLPGIVFYKTVNTLDSMIGYKTAKYQEFGWASARLDDIVNIIPSRLTCFLFALASKKPGNVLKISFQNAKNHRSPNAGWPESAMAGALNIRLSGPRKYGNKFSNEPWLNPTGLLGKTQNILDALIIYKISIASFLVLLVIYQIIYFTYNSVF